MNGSGIKATALRDICTLLTKDTKKVADLYGKLDNPGSFRKSYEIDKVVEQICLMEFDRVDSPSLRLEKTLHIKGSISAPDARGNTRLYKFETRGPEIKAVVTCFNERRDKSLKRRPVFASGFTMALGGPLIVNQAGGVLENAGLLLHRHFGVPYIPGSALKGCARHAAWRRWSDERDEAARNNLALKTAFTFGFPTGDGGKNSEFLDRYLQERIFKNTGKDFNWSGKVSFLPAFPEGDVELLVDIVNCHHMEYYQGKRGEEALDNENPNPQPFPAVKEGAIFYFEVVPLQSVAGHPAFSGLEKDFNPLDFAVDCLKTGLTQNGIGTKTAAGYGWFKPVNQIRPLIDLSPDFGQSVIPSPPVVPMTPEEQEEKDFRRYSLLNVDIHKILRLIDDFDTLSPVQKKTFCSFLSDKEQGGKFWQELKGMYASSLRRFNERGKEKFLRQAKNTQVRIDKIAAEAEKHQITLSGVSE